MTLEEPALSTMWETSALGEWLERKGVLTWEEIYAAINELRQQHPDATALERPVPYQLRRAK